MLYKTSTSSNSKQDEPAVIKGAEVKDDSMHVDNDIHVIRGGPLGAETIKTQAEPLKKIPPTAVTGDEALEACGSTTT